MSEEQSIILPQRISRRELIRRSRERRTKISVLIFGLVLALLILGIPVYGYYQEFVAPGLGTIVRVNDTILNVNYYLKMLRLRVAQQSQPDYSQVPIQLVQDLVNEELVRQGVPKLGIHVTPEEIDQELKNRVLGEEGPKEVDQKEAQADFKRRYQSRLRELKLSDKEYQRLVEIDLLRDKLREQLGKTLPVVAEHIKVQAILLDNEEEGRKFAARLEKVEDFAALVKELSIDNDLKEKGGDLGWLLRGIMGAEFDEEAFKLDVGTLSKPIPTRTGYYLIKVSEKSPAREISPEHMEKLKDNALQNWLVEEEKQNKVERFFNSDRYAWAVDRIQEQLRK